MTMKMTTIQSLEETDIQRMIREEAINVLEARFAQPLKKILNSDGAYAILDDSPANGGTWCAGGCAILAHALNMLYGYEVYVIYDHDYHQVDHFIVKTPKGTYMDCDGEQLDILRNFKRKEMFQRPQARLEIMPYKEGLKITGIPVDMQASRELADYIKKSIEDVNNGNEMKEGVADKYAERRFHMSDPVADMDVKAGAQIQKNEEQPVAYVKNAMLPHEVPIYKNPKSLSNFDREVRAIGDPQGNIYVAQRRGIFVHGEMAVVLGFFKDDMDAYRNQDKYLLIQRVDKENAFGLNDTSSDRIQGSEKNYQETVMMMKRAKAMNPQYEFFPEPFNFVQGDPV